MITSLKQFNPFSAGLHSGLSATRHRSVTLVNQMSVVTAATALILAPLLTIFTGKPILLPGLTEAGGFIFTLWLNHRRRYDSAAVLMLLFQNLAAGYFGVQFGTGVPIKMLCLALGMAPIFIFTEKQSKKNLLPCLGLSFAVLMLVNLNEEYHFITSWVFTITQKHYIIILADVIIYLLTLIVFVSFTMQLQRASDNKTVYLRDQNHEINRSLKSMNATLDKYLLNTGKSRDVQIRTDDWKNLLRQVKKIENSVSGGLDFTRIEAGMAGQALLETFDLKVLINEVIEDYAPFLQRVKVYIPTTNPDSVLIRTDREKLSIILNNLLFNAIKFSKKDGVVEINVVNLEKYLQIEVIDYGKGIPPERIAGLFSSLFVSDHDNRLSQGSGIGLVNVKSMVDILGGTIDVESEPGKGSIFTVTLPLLSERSGSYPVAISNATVSLKDKTLAVIDDDVFVRSFIHQTISEMGCERIIEAADGQEAIQKLSTQNADIILVDFKLQQESGIEVIRKLKTIKHLSGSIYITFTSEDSSEIRQEASDHGSYYLKKPIGISETGKFKDAINKLFAVKK